MDPNEPLRLDEEDVEEVAAVVDEVEAEGVVVVEGEEGVSKIL